MVSVVAVIIKLKAFCAAGHCAQPASRLALHTTIRDRLKFHTALPDLRMDSAQPACRPFTIVQQK